MREFVAKPKKLKLTLNGTPYEMRVPSMSENDQLEADLKSNPDGALTVYKTFFKSLGLEEAAMNSMAVEDFLEFIKFVFNPKYQGSQPTP